MTLMCPIFSKLEEPYPTVFFWVFSLLAILIVYLIGPLKPIHRLNALHDIEQSLMTIIKMGDEESLLGNLSSMVKDDKKTSKDIYAKWVR
jgi:hypothetical protein